MRMLSCFPSIFTVSSPLMSTFFPEECRLLNPVRVYRCFVLHKHCTTSPQIMSPGSTIATMSRGDHTHRHPIAVLQAYLHIESGPDLHIESNPIYTSSPDPQCSKKTSMPEHRQSITGVQQGAHSRGVVVVEVRAPGGGQQHIQQGLGRQPQPDCQLQGSFPLGPGLGPC